MYVYVQSSFFVSLISPSSRLGCQFIPTKSPSGSSQVSRLLLVEVKESRCPVAFPTSAKSCPYVFLSPPPFFKINYLE